MKSLTTPVEGQAARLRELINQGGPHAVPGVFNPLVAIQAEKAGFPCVYLSGGAFSSSLGLPDLGLVSLTELRDMVHRIASVISVPLIVDADTGFGEAINVARATVELERAGAAAIHIEDQQIPKRCGHLAGKRLIPTDQMVEKLVAALSVRRSMLVIARTDARSVEGFDAAVKRAKRYKDAGADIIFPEALQSEEEFAEFARCVGGPLIANMTEFGRSPLMSRKRLGALGYTFVLYPVTSLRLASFVVGRFFQSLKEEDNQVPWLDQMMTRRELYDLIAHDEYLAFGERILVEVERTRRTGGA